MPGALEREGMGATISSSDSVRISSVVWVSGMPASASQS